ncbi:hypothetical protein R1sor_013058 [Riccia sorocarpa]|uniref:F-box domain-containing protein n=1 Tax=Riccia sorocarpa TaxID=122646 RepID=A0ABD3HBI8_9MARC
MDTLSRINARWLMDLTVGIWVAFFKALWSLGLHRRDGIFLWRIIFRSFFMGSRASSMGVSEGTCLFCALHLEDVPHLLFFCPSKAQFWQQIASSFPLLGGFVTDLLAGHPFPSVFQIILDFTRGLCAFRKKLLRLLWKLRCDFLFQGVCDIGTFHKPLIQSVEVLLSHVSRSGKAKRDLAKRALVASLQARAWIPEKFLLQINACPFCVDLLSENVSLAQGKEQAAKVTRVMTLRQLHSYQIIVTLAFLTYEKRGPVLGVHSLPYCWHLPRLTLRKGQFLVALAEKLVPLSSVITSYHGTEGGWQAGWIWSSRAVDKEEPGLSMGTSEEGLMVGGRYLSKEVMCRILGRLPTRSFLRLRCVCKRWYSIMEDADFRAICASLEFQTSTLQISDRIPFLIWESAADSAKPLLAFDLLSRKWRLFPLLEGAWSKLTVLSSSRGLLLATTANGDGENDFITVNPLTKLQRQIPPMIDVNSLKFNVRQIVMDAAMEGKYFVIAEEVQSKKRARGDVATPTAPKLQIFDSNANAWELAGELRPGLTFKHAVSMRGTLLCLATSGKEGSDVKSVQVFRFDGSSSWAELQTELPVCIGPSYRRWTPRLFEYKQHLMLVGESSSSNNKAVCVWQLDEEKMEWVQVQIMPAKLYEDIVGSNEFSACEEFLCMHPSREERNRAIICNLSTGDWQIVPYKTPRLSEQRRTAFIQDNFCFYEARLGAMA